MYKDDVSSILQMQNDLDSGLSQSTEANAQTGSKASPIIALYPLELRFSNRSLAELDMTVI